jgi:hypothetical protein
MGWVVPKFLIARPLTRSALLLVLLMITTSLPWATFINKPYIPSQAALHLGHYLFKTRILRQGTPHSQILEVFLETEALRSLAVPPDKGGPRNQMVFILNGCATLATLTLITIPNTWSQILVLIVAMSATIGYAISMGDLEGIPMAQLEPAVWAHAAVTAIGIVGAVIAI